MVNSAVCDTCGVDYSDRPLVAFAEHGIMIGPFKPGGQKVLKRWRSCPTCEAADQKRWAEQRADEAREKAEREERSRRAAERDAARAEKQRESKQEVA